MSEDNDLRLDRNFNESPEMGEATLAPDSPRKTGVAKMMWAWHGLIQPTERMFLFGVLQSMSQKYIRAVEIGTWRGTTMHVLRRACDELTCIDPEPQWIEDESVVTRSGNQVKLIKGFSPADLDKIPGPYTFAFVDGDHSEEGVYRDTMALEPLMESGGVICFHDAHHPPCAAGIKRAAEDWKRKIDFYDVACDTISRTPDGVFGGIAMFIVEEEDQPDSEPASFYRKNPEDLSSEKKGFLSKIFG